MSTVKFPLANALVVAIRNDKRFAQFTYTDADGNAQLQLPIGTYDVFVVGEGTIIHHQVEILDKDKVKIVTLQQVAVEKIPPPYVLYVEAPLYTLQAFLYLIQAKPHYWQTLPELEREILSQAIEKMQILYPGFVIYGPCNFNYAGLRCLHDFTETDAFIETVVKSYIEYIDAVEPALSIA